MNSSLRTEELTSISTRSTTTVGTSAIITRRRALAMLELVLRSSNFHEIVTHFSDFDFMEALVGCSPLLGFSIAGYEEREMS